MNDLTRLIEWLKTNPGITGAEALYFRGQFSETAANAESRLVSVQAVGGGRTDIDLDSTGYRVLLFGPQTAIAGESEALHEALRNMQKRLKTDYKTCDVAQIKVIGGIIGPGRTTENRPWYEINLELLT